MGTYRDQSYASVARRHRAAAAAGLDRALALQILDEMDAIRRKHYGALPPPCDYYLRAMEAVVARAAGYDSRSDWTDALKEDKQSRYYHDLQILEKRIGF